MGKSAKMLIATTGFIYGLVLALYAFGWGVDGPTLTMPLAASPLNVPAAVVDSNPQVFNSLMPALPVLIVAPILAAPFCWAAMAWLVTYAQNSRRRRILTAVLLAHYLGIAAWCVLMGSDYLLRPFRVLIFEGRMLLAFYAAGQIVMWWALLRYRSRSVAATL